MSENQQSTHGLLLDRSFYLRDTQTVAKELLGTYLVLETDSGPLIGQIIETEAYPGVGDRASHSSKGLTPRTKTLFGPAGLAYVYLIYGIYHCLNVVCDTPESGAAVLIRAVKPIAGLTGKTTGPGLLCKAYGIDRRFNGHDLALPPLQIVKPTGKQAFEILASPRVGIDYAGPDKDLPYRYKIAS